MILGVHHPAISVPSMSEALEFYSGKLGFEAVMEAEIPSGVDVMSQAFGIADSGYKVAMLRKGNSCIELFEFAALEGSEADARRPVNRHGISHIGLASDDYELDFGELQAAGVVFNSAPMGGPPNRWAYGRDPFGNVIELLEHAPGSAAALDFRR